MKRDRRNKHSAETSGITTQLFYSFRKYISGMASSRDSHFTFHVFFWPSSSSRNAVLMVNIKKGLNVCNYAGFTDTWAFVCDHLPLYTWNVIKLTNGCNIRIKSYDLHTPTVYCIGLPVGPGVGPTSSEILKTFWFSVFSYHKSVSNAFCFLFFFC